MTVIIREIDGNVSFIQKVTSIKFFFDDTIGELLEVFSKPQENLVESNRFEFDAIESFEVTND